MSRYRSAPYPGAWRCKSCGVGVWPGAATGGVWSGNCTRCDYERYDDYVKADCPHCENGYTKLHGNPCAHCWGVGWVWKQK